MADPGRRLQIALTVLGSAGLALPFVPFTYHVVPFTDVLLDVDFTDQIWMMAAPTIVLPLPIVAGYALRLFASRVPDWADAAGLLLALAAMFLFLMGAGAALDDGDVWGLVIVLALFAYSGGIWSSRRPRDADYLTDGLIAMQAAYLPPTVFWVIFAMDSDFDTGAWLAVVTVVAYVPQIFTNAARRGRTLSLFAPLAAMATIFLTAE